MRWHSKNDAALQIISVRVFGVFVRFVRDQKQPLFASASPRFARRCRKLRYVAVQKPKREPRFYTKTHVLRIAKRKNDAENSKKHIDFFTRRRNQFRTFYIQETLIVASKRRNRARPSLLLVLITTSTTTTTTTKTTTTTTTSTNYYYYYYYLY